MYDFYLMGASPRVCLLEFIADLNTRVFQRKIERLLKKYPQMFFFLKIHFSIRSRRVLSYKICLRIVVSNFINGSNGPNYRNNTSAQPFGNEKKHKIVAENHVL